MNMVAVLKPILVYSCKVTVWKTYRSSRISSKNSLNCLSQCLDHSSLNSWNSRTRGKPEIQSLLYNLSAFCFSDRCWIVPASLDLHTATWHNMISQQKLGHSSCFHLSWHTGRARHICQTQNGALRQRQTPTRKHAVRETHLYSCSVSCVKILSERCQLVPWMLFDQSECKRSWQQLSKQQQRRFICMYIN